MPQLLDKSGAAAVVGESRGCWLSGDDFVSSEPEQTPELPWLGSLGFPRDWPAVYGSNPRLKSLIGKRGRIPAKRVSVAGEPTDEERGLCKVRGVCFHPLQSFANARRAALGSAGLSTVEGWAIFERLDRPPGEVFVAERYWWNALPDGRWVDLTPRPEACPVVLLAEAAQGAPKRESLLTAEEAALAERLFAQRFPSLAARAAPAPAQAKVSCAPVRLTADQGASPLDYSKWDRVLDSDEEDEQQQHAGARRSPLADAAPLSEDIGIKDLLDDKPALLEPPALPEFVVGKGGGGGGTNCLQSICGLLDTTLAKAADADAVHQLAHTFSRMFRCGMLDEPRQRFYREGLAAAPQGAFVIILGLGSVLPLLGAARRGPGLLLEMSSKLGAVAEELLKANGASMPVAVLAGGLADGPSVSAVVRKHLPRSAKEVVILTERFGHDLLSNGVVPIAVAAHAAVAAVAPDARIQHVPQTIELLACPAEIRSENIGQFDIRAFNAFRNTSSNDKADFWWWPVRLDNQPSTNVALLGPARTLCGFDFHRSPEIGLEEVRLPLNLKITARGRCNAVALWWRARSGALEYSTEPELAKEEARRATKLYRPEWKQAVHYVAGETDVFVGDSLELLASITPRFTVRMIQQSPFSVVSPPWIQAPSRPDLASTLPILPYHFLMMMDVERLEVYTHAIRDAVRNQRERLGRRPRVLDAGCGIGLLGMSAATEGAEVWLCEAVPTMRNMCREVLAGNAGLIQQKRGLCQLLPPMMSTDLKVGEHVEHKFDIIISEVMDLWCLGEGVIPTMKHAHGRLLAEGGSMMPSRVAILVQPLELAPWGQLERQHKMKLSPLASALKSKYSPMRLEHFPCRWLTDEPLPALEIDLASVPPQPRDGAPNLEGSNLCIRMGKKPALAARTTRMSMDTSGMLCGFGVWWSADLGNGHLISTSPSSGQRSWKQLVRWQPEPRHVAECEEVSVLACYTEMQFSVEEISPTAEDASQWQRKLALDAAAQRSRHGTPEPAPKTATAQPAPTSGRHAAVVAQEELLVVD